MSQQDISIIKPKTPVAMFHHTARDMYHCEFCDGYFGVPGIPKTLPCMHVLCRDCIIALIESQKSLGEYSEEEYELYCPKCRKYIQIPVGTPDVLPTPFKRIKCAFDDLLCNDASGCTNKAFGYCYECQVTFCLDHSMPHTKRSHSVEVFKSGKFCIHHMKQADTYCYTCERIICSLCLRDSHRKHHTGPLSLFYSHFMKNQNLPMMYQNLRYLSNSITRIQTLSSPQTNMELINHLKDVNYVIRMGMHTTYPACSNYSLSTSTIIILPVGTTKAIAFDELFNGFNTAVKTLQVNAYPVEPISHPKNTAHLNFAVIDFNTKPRRAEEGGSIKVEVTRKQLDITGEREGDVLLSIVGDGIDIDSSPIRVRVAPPLKTIATCATSDKHKSYISYICGMKRGYCLVDSGNDCVKVIANNFMIFGGRGSGKGQFKSPFGVTVGNVDKDEWVWVVDKGNDRIQVFVKGRYVRSYQKEGKYALKSPSACVYLPKEKLLYVTDTRNHRISIFALDGTFINSIGVDLNEPTDIKAVTMANQTMFLIADTGNNRVVVTNKQGYVIRAKGGIGERRRGRFVRPVLLAVDNCREEIYVSEGGTRIQKLNYNLDYVQTYDLRLGDITAMYYDHGSDVLTATGSQVDSLCQYSQALLSYYVI